MVSALTNFHNKQKITFLSDFYHNFCCNKMLKLKANLVPPYGWAVALFKLKEYFHEDPSSLSD
jgi:hypothetical protein